MLTVTPVQPLGRVACEEMQCPFTFPLKDAASVSVSAYNTHGATVPSYLAMPIPGINCHSVKRNLFRATTKNLEAVESFKVTASQLRYVFMI